MLRLAGWLCLIAALIVVSVGMTGCAGAAQMAAARQPATLTAGTPAEPLAEPAQRLSEVMPADLLAYADAPGMQRLSDVVAQITRWVDVLDLAGRAIATDTGIDAGAATAFLRDLSEVAVGLSLDSQWILALRASDPHGTERLLAEEEVFRPAGDVAGGARRYRFVRETPRTTAELELRWYPHANTLLVGSAAMLDRAGAVIDHRAPSLAAKPQFAAAAARFAADPSLNLYIDLPALLRKRGSDVEALSALQVAVTLGDGVALEAQAAFAASGVPENVYAPPVPFGLPDQLPADTIAFLAYSSKLGGPRADKGRTILLLLEALGVGTAASIVGGGRSFGVDPSPSLTGLGDEGVIGLVLPPAPISPSESAAWNGVMLLARQRLDDPDAVRRMLDAVRDKLSQSPAMRVEPTRGGFFAQSPTKPVGVASVVRGDQLIVALGDARTARKLGDAVGRTLGEDDAYRRTKDRLSGSHMGLWFDVSRSLEALGDALPGDPRELKMLARSSAGTRAIGSLTFGFEPEGEGLRLHLGMHDAASMGVVSAIAIHGVRRYLASAKAAEAKANVDMISRAAAAAFERERDGGRRRLCANATPVPTEIPSGRKYMPSRIDGEDFLSGDADAGWRCLRFALTQPHYFRYSYRRGGGYLGPARGGPDPGPQGFEVAAEGDLDGDGITSLFTRVGHFDPTSGAIELSPEIFIVDEHE